MAAQWARKTSGEDVDVRDMARPTLNLAERMNQACRKFNRCYYQNAELLQKMPRFGRARGKSLTLLNEFKAYDPSVR